MRIVRRHIPLCLLMLVLLPAGLFAAEERSELNAEYWWEQFFKFFNFVVLVVALYFILRKPLRKFLEDRARQIDETIKAAASAKEEAEHKLAEVDRLISGLQKEMEEIRQRAVAEGEAEKAKIIEAARREAERILEEARREIDSRVKAGRQELKSYAAELAVERARELLKERLTSEDDRRLVNRFLDEIGGAV